MAVDPSQLAPPGLPAGAGVPPPPGALAGGPGMAPAGPAGPPPDPSTDPNAVLAVLQAMKEQGMASFDQQQNSAIAQGVSMMLQQTPNQPGMDATTMPGSPVPPPMPGADPNAPPSGATGGY